MDTPSASPLRLRLRAALVDARKGRDEAAVSVLRATISAIENAEAVDPVTSTSADGEFVAGGAHGLGAAEATRRMLSEADIAAVVAAELAELLDAAGTYERIGRSDHADGLRAGAAVLSAVLDA